MARPRFSRLANATYVRYGVSSVAALAADMGLFMGLLRIGISPVAASATGYAFGILIHWIFSSRLVFPAGTAAAGPARRRQKGLFIGSALVGLALTTGIVALSALLGLMPIMAKLIAIVLSFQATYMLRKAVVFAA